MKFRITAAAPRAACECADPGCAVHKGSNRCDGVFGEILFRVDTDDETGTAFCSDCTDDAFESGLYYSKDAE